MGLYDELLSYSDKNVYPMHMPGHKRNDKLLYMINPYQIDITEIDGFDNMHNATGLIKDIEDRCMNMYGAGATYLSVSGSSIGILASIAACTNRGDKVLIARNCHKAVYNAIYLNDLKPSYIYPDMLSCGISAGISLDNIKEIVENNKLVTDLRDEEKKNNSINNKYKAVVITSPTYEGIISDISSISKYLHSKGIMLIVDSAHGAHLGLSNLVPDNMLNKGADIVIHSIHKTLPAMTQTALVHVNKNSMKLTERLKRYMSIYQTSSPSYILLSGIDRCFNIIEKQGDKLYKEYVENLNYFYEKTSELKYIKVLDFRANKDGCTNNKFEYNKIYDYDFGKIIIACHNDDKRFVMAGEYIYNELINSYRIQPEMKSQYYVIAMTSICDTKEGFDRLEKALKDMDSNIAMTNIINSKEWDIDKSIIIKPRMKYTVYETDLQEMECINVRDSLDRICGEFIYLFPPGIPIIVPGEIITKDVIDMFIEYEKSGLSIHGLIEGSNGNIKVTKRR